MRQNEIVITLYQKESRRQKWFSKQSLSIWICIISLLISTICNFNIWAERNRIDSIIKNTIEMNKQIEKRLDQEKADCINKVMLINKSQKYNNTTKNEIQKFYTTENLNVELQQYAYEQCKSQGIPFDIFMGLMWKESKYDINAVSKDGRDKGICQIRESCHKEELERLGITDIMDPKQNIKAAVHILAPYVRQYEKESMHLALMCYNQGKGGAKTFWHRGIYSTNYSRDIVNFAKRI